MFEAFFDKLLFLGTLPIVIILYLVFGLVLGLLAVFTDGFSRVYTLILGGFLFLILKTPLIARMAGSRAARIRSIAATGLFFGVVGLWVSLVFSKQGVANPVTLAYETAGFPMRAMTYPMPPMGSDFIPREMWAPFFLNLLIWVLVGWVIASLVPRVTARFERRSWIAPVFTVLMSLYGLAYLLSQFD